MKSNYDYTRDNLPAARKLRKNMTPEEKKLWYRCLSLLPVTVHRQKNIGKYIVDFYISHRQTVIELDGIQHTGPDAITSDMIRDCYLREKNITVLRYTNAQINDDFSWVVGDILNKIELNKPETYEYMDKKLRNKWESRGKHKDPTGG